MIIPQAVFRPYRILKNAPLAAGMFRLVVEAEGEPIPLFQPGQWVNIRLFNPDGSEWAKAAYSMASAPKEGMRQLEFGIKMEGDFTKRLAGLHPGDQIALQGPWGMFVLDQSRSRHVCIAGGIGITPFVSMAREAAVTGQDITMLYSTRTVPEAAYLDELREFAAVRPNIRVICTCTRGTPPGWSGESGRVNNAMLSQVIADDTQYLLCGPNAFMDEVRALLVARGVETKQIKQESFG